MFLKIVKKLSDFCVVCSTSKANQKRENTSIRSMCIPELIYIKENEEMKKGNKEVGGEKRGEGEREEREREERGRERRGE